MLDISRPYGTFNKRGLLFILPIFSPPQADCTVSDPTMAWVESEIKIFESPVRDDIYSYRTTMI
jgi:hypothetical protein